MARYLIKCTYTSGKFKGHSWFLTKGGYVTSDAWTSWGEMTYASLGIAKRRCRELQEENERNYADESWAIERHKIDRPFRLYEHEVYEPYYVPLVYGYSCPAIL